MSQTIADIISNPSYHDYLAILKGARNGFVYGVKVRFPHALVMSILFGRGRCVCLVSVRTHNINNPPHLSIIGLLAPLGTCHIPIHFSLTLAGKTVQKSYSGQPSNMHLISLNSCLYTRSVY